MRALEVGAPLGNLRQTELVVENTSKARPLTITAQLVG